MTKLLLVLALLGPGTLAAAKSNGTPFHTPDSSTAFHTSAPSAPAGTCDLSSALEMKTWVTRNKSGNGSYVDAWGLFHSLKSAESWCHRTLQEMRDAVAAGAPSKVDVSRLRCSQPYKLRAEGGSDAAYMDQTHEYRIDIQIEPTIGEINVKKCQLYKACYAQAETKKTMDEILARMQELSCDVQ